ncbi:MAG: glycerophosphodiester phosphodiesterase, partial [Deltaproteobacteria bacterium]
VDYYMSLFENLSPTLNIAHRGARSLAPENTLVAARKAQEHGADMWELDVRMTCDGELIVIHDTSLKRTSNVRDLFPGRKSWNVHEFSLEEISRLDFGSWFNKQDPFGQIAAGVVGESELASYVGEPAPTLRQALSFTKEQDWIINVEIKDLSGTPGHTRISKQVLALVEELNMVDTVLISSFNHEYLLQLRAAHPHIATGVLVSSPHPHPDALLQRFKAQAYHPRITPFLPKRDIVSLQRQGFHVNVRTANEPKTMLRLVQAGVSGIFTDFPQLLTSVLANHRGNKKPD